MIQPYKNGTRNGLYLSQLNATQDMINSSTSLNLDFGYCLAPNGTGDV